MRFLKKICLFTYLVLTAPGLCCCTRLSPVVVLGLLRRWLLWLWSTGSLGCRASAAVAPQHAGSSWTRDRTSVLCTGRQILNHWTTRKVLLFVLSRYCRLGCCDHPMGVKWTPHQKKKKKVGYWDQWFHTCPTNVNSSCSEASGEPVAGFLAAETLECLTAMRSWAQGRAPSAGLAWLALPAGTGGGSSRPFLVN